MMQRVVIDTNIWIRILLRGRVTLPILTAFNDSRFQLVMSQPLFDEFHTVWNHPRLKQRLDVNQAIRLEQQLRFRSVWIEVSTIPPNCRDPKDLPVLATAIDGAANIIVSGDNDLRADDDGSERSGTHHDATPSAGTGSPGGFNGFAGHEALNTTRGMGDD